MDTEVKRAIPPDEAIERRIDALLARMTLAEKVGQLTSWSASIFGAFDMGALIQQLVDGAMTIEEFESLPRDYHEQEIRDGLVGSLGGAPDVGTLLELQRIAVEESRLGIPILFGFDVIHGFRTIFPTPLAEACSWEPELARRTAAVAAKEASAAGLNWTYAPMVDIARDPRWGRIAEGSGEDKFLGSAFAVARVEGFQGDLSSDENVLACVKHYAAYGAAVGGRDYNTVDLSLPMLHDVYLPPFEAAARAGAATFMSAFNDVNGVPCTANPYLLDTVLREWFGFTGFVVSDANAVGEVVIHGYVEDIREACRKAVSAGVEMDMSHGYYRDNLPGLVADGSLPEPVLDEAVRRVLRVKFRLGLFERPYRTDAAKAERTLLASAHVDLAREAARRSIVLLKNEGGVLPLSKGLHRIAVVGPLADDRANLLGTWAGVGKPEDCVSVLEGLRAAAGSATAILYAPGCGILGDDTTGFADAIRAAELSDVVVAVVGESKDMSGEAGSRIDLCLPGVQEELVRTLVDTGRPVVVVLVNGRPLAFPWIQAHAAAVVESWQLGVQHGPAVADVLFGAYNPSGRLAATFPHSVGQVPVYYDHPMTGRPAAATRFSSKYIDGPTEPLYPFGFGLSYTEFAYSDLRVDAREVAPDGTVAVEVDVANVGPVFGEEVVQLYVTDLVGARVRPVRELKGFRKIALMPGEKRTVRFDLEIATLGYHDEALRYLVEPGEFRIAVGPDSQRGLAETIRVVAG